MEKNSWIAFICASDDSKGEWPGSLSSLGGIKLVDFAVASVRRSMQILDLNNIYLFISSRWHEEYLEWAASRGFPSKNIFFKETHFQVFSDALAEDNNWAGVMIVSANVLFDLSFRVDDVLDSIHEYDGGILRKATSCTEGRDCTFLASTALLALRASSVVAKASCLRKVKSYDAFCRAVAQLVNEGSSSSSLPSTPSLSLLPVAEEGCLFVRSWSELEQAKSRVAEELAELSRQLPTHAEEICYARVGLMGNPSDGFQGKTLSFQIKNFFAQVALATQEDPTNRKVEIIPHPELDPTTFDGLDGLHLFAESHGYYGGVRLIMATCKVFSECCAQSGQLIQWLRPQGFKVSYNTTIPRMVGLSGSSAIIVATFRCLMKFYGLSLAKLNIAKDEFPTVILSVEKKELGINAGLQDRVIQTYGGLVRMDFSSTTGSQKVAKGVYTRLDPTLLPPMYLVYNCKVGGDSGVVHSTVKERWAKRDPELLAGMTALGNLADEARNLLQQFAASSISAEHLRWKMAEKCDQNFAWRRKLYGDAVVGRKNIAAVELANQFGLSSKFTGSGGALVCIKKEGGPWLDPLGEAEAKAAFAQLDYNIIRIQPSTQIYSDEEQ